MKGRQSTNMNSRQFYDHFLLAQHIFDMCWQCSESVFFIYGSCYKNFLENFYFWLEERESKTETNMFN